MTTALTYKGNNSKPCMQCGLILGDQLKLNNPALKGIDAAQDCILIVENS